jgi:NTE family protein
MEKYILENKILKHVILFLILLSLSSCQSSFIKKIYKFRLQEPEPITNDIRVALVLGGGGARAIAQIGVIEVLQQNNIPIDMVIGTSGGSVIGALYADNPNIENLKKIGLNFKKSELIKLSLKDAIEGTTTLRGGFDGSLGEKFLNENLSAKDFKDLKIPFIAIATDIKSGKTIALRSGKISPAVRASCSIPGLFSPVEIYDMILVDGGVTAPLAVDEAKKYNPELIIAVDVSMPIKEENITNMFELAHRAANISYIALTELNGKSADILIKPQINDVGIFDDHKNNELYIEGKKAAEKLLPKIKSMLKIRLKNSK